MLIPHSGKLQVQLGKKVAIRGKVGSQMNTLPETQENDHLEVKKKIFKFNQPLSVRRV